VKCVKFSRLPLARFLLFTREWAKSHNLQKGSQVNLEVTSDGKLFVDTQFASEPEPKSVSLKVNPYLSREIIGRYLLVMIS
jgi:hypothetical protein